MARDLGIDAQKSSFAFIVKHLYDLFIDRDAEVLEINPLVLTVDDKLLVGHAGIKIDQSSLYRQ